MAMGCMVGKTLRGNLAYGGGPHEWLDDSEGMAAPPRTSTPLMGNIAAHLADMFPRRPACPYHPQLGRQSSRTRPMAAR